MGCRDAESGTGEARGVGLFFAGLFLAAAAGLTIFVGLEKVVGAAASGGGEWAVSMGARGASPWGGGS